VAEGKLRVARARRQPLPAGWIVGPDGQPSNDVEDFYRGGMLLPFGGHKGYALSVLAALFGGLAGDGTPGRINGVFLLALDPGAFGDAAAYTQTVAAALETLRATPAAPGSIGVQAPGEPERASRRLREQAIPLPPGTISELDAVAKRFGLTPPQALTEHRLLGEFLAHDYGLAPSQVLAALDRQQAASGERRRLGELLLELGWLDPARLEQALARQRADDEARR
jgi:hypothetical protein